MIFRYTILYVEDVPATLGFYEQAFGLTRAFVHETNDFAELATGETRLAFCSTRLLEQMGKKVSGRAPDVPSSEIAFETDDVAAALARAVAAGAELVQGVEDMPWGQTTAYVRAPEGTFIEICTAVTPQTA